MGCVPCGEEIHMSRNCVALNRLEQGIGRNFGQRQSAGNDVRFICWSLGSEHVACGRFLRSCSTAPALDAKPNQAALW